MHWAWAILGVTVWIGFAALARWVVTAATREDAESGVVLRAFQVYARVVHRLRVEGAEHIPPAHAPGTPEAGGAPGPLVIVANHTAGVDPILIQAACAFEISWVMAEDMAKPGLEPLWKLGRVIKIDRTSGDSMGVREAIRRLRAGGVIGVFPEGHIERPPRKILPFAPGVGLFIARTGASVLPIVVDGAPQVDPAWSSLWRTSRSRLTVLPVRRYARRGEPGAKSAHQIAQDLREVFLRATGWPANDDPRPMKEGPEGYWG